MGAVPWERANLQTDSTAIFMGTIVTDPIRRKGGQPRAHQASGSQQLAPGAPGDHGLSRQCYNARDTTRVTTGHRETFCAGEAVLFRHGGIT